MKIYQNFLLALALLSSNVQNAFAQKAGGFEVVTPNSLASAMMMGLINQDSVFIIDKFENNPDKFDSNNAPVTGSILSLKDNTVRAVPIRSNAFCATASLLPNGTWAVFGGNQAVGYGGTSVTDGTGPYSAFDGRKAVRLMNPQRDNDDLVWLDDVNLQMANTRWYASSETLANGEVVIIGGATSGGYINRNIINTDPAYSGGGADPTFEFYPSRNVTPAVSQFMVETSGLNTYAHAFLMPSGKMFLQANWSTTLWDYNTNVEAKLPDMPDRIIRIYPASGATAMLPLTPENNYTPTILFCGGTNGLTEAQWGWYGGPGSNILDIAASDDCSSITPESSDGTFNSSVEYVREERMPIGRTMGQFVHLPTGQMVIVNGASKGTAGYTNATYNTVGGVFTEGLAQDPVYQPLLYDPSKKKGSRLSNEGFSSSSIARLYHSTAILVPDGSVLIAGSNPHQDVALNMPVGTNPQAFNTTYEIEKWYPPYYFEDRPSPQGVPDEIGYGGNTFNVTMDAAYMGSSSNYKARNTKFMVIRPGFSTHAMNMGQRSLQLDHTYTVNDDGSVTYMVNPMPTNPNIFVPGPALLFVTIAGIPSVGKFVQLGDLLNKVLPAEVTIGAEPTTLPSPVNKSAFNDDPTKSPIENIGFATFIGSIAAGVVVFLLLLLGIICWRRRSKAKRKTRSLPTTESPSTDLASGGVGGGVAAQWNNRNGDYERVRTPNSSVHQQSDASPSRQSSNGALKSQLDQYQMNDYPSQGSQASNNWNYHQSPTTMSPASHLPAYQEQHFQSQSSPLTHVNNENAYDQGQYNESTYEQSQPSDYYQYQDSVQAPLVTSQEPQLNRQASQDGYGGFIDSYAQQDHHPYTR